MKKKIVCLFCALMLWLTACGVPGVSDVKKTVAFEVIVTESSSPDIVTEVPTEVVEPTLSAEEQEQARIDTLADAGVYTLKGAFSFYQGSVDMSYITSITFTDVAPAEYDEMWSANEAETDDIVGYRCDDAVYIVGEHIYLNSWSAHMFQGQNNYGDLFWCNLKEINGLERLNTSKAKRFDMMFAYSPIEGTIDGIANWDMSAATSLNCMFAWAVNLTHLDIANWNVSNVEDFTGMFQGNSHKGDMQFQYLDVSKWNMSSAESVAYMFYGCGLLEYVPVENWDVRNVETFSHMFADCFVLSRLDVSKWETLSVVSFDAFLNDCHSLTIIDVSGLDTATCRQFSQMFETCTNLEEIIGLDTWDVSNADHYAFSETFHCCYKLKYLDIGSWSTIPDNMARMLKNCYELQSVDLSGFDVSSLTTIKEMCMGCKNLIELIGFDIAALQSVSGYDTAFIESPLAAQVRFDDLL